MLLSSWREYVCQTLEQDSRAPESLLDGVRGDGGATESGREQRDRNDSQGLQNAKTYLASLAAEDPALEPDESADMIGRFKRRFIIQDKSHATIFQAIDDVTKQSVILKERYGRLPTQSRLQ